MQHILPHAVWEWLTQKSERKGEDYNVSRSEQLMVCQIIFYRSAEDAWHRTTLFSINNSKTDLLWFRDNVYLTNK